MSKFLQVLSVMADGRASGLLEDFAHFVRDHKIAVLTDFPYKASGTEREAGEALTQGKIQVCNGSCVSMS